MGSPESLKMYGIPKIVHDFFSGIGSVGKPESFKMHRFPNIFHDFFRGMGDVGSVENIACGLESHAH